MMMQTKQCDTFTSALIETLQQESYDDTTSGEETKKSHDF